MSSGGQRAHGPSPAARGVPCRRSPGDSSAADPILGDPATVPASPDVVRAEHGAPRLDEGGGTRGACRTAIFGGAPFRGGGTSFLDSDSGSVLGREECRGPGVPLPSPRPLSGSWGGSCGCLSDGGAPLPFLPLSGSPALSSPDASLDLDADYTTQPLLRPRPAAPNHWQPQMPVRPCSMPYHPACCRIPI